jgi:DNA-directed RNA polymerase subunit L
MVLIKDPIYKNLLKSRQAVEPFSVDVSSGFSHQKSYKYMQFPMGKGITMEINVLEDTKKRMVFDLKGEDHTLCNALREELWNDEAVTVAAYNISHPLIGVPKFIIETNDKSTPKEALKDAVKRLQKKNDNLIKQVQKDVK